MSKPNHVTEVRVTVTLANGDSHTLVTENPKPAGSNPRFIAQQIESGMTTLAKRLDGHVADIYGDQIRSTR